MKTAGVPSLDRVRMEALQLEKLQRLLALVSEDNPFYSAKLRKAGVRPHVASLEEFLTTTPFTHKTEIVDNQAQYPPYGSNLTYPLDRYIRFTQTSGTTGRPIRWLDTRENWEWMIDCWVRVYESARARPGDRVFFPFSFGPFLGFWIAFEAAAKIGCLAISGGGMRSAARIQTILDNEVTILCSTPSYALHLAEVARDDGLDLRQSKVRAIILAGEPGGSLPSTRALIERLWPGACVVDHHGMTEIGPVSYECPERPGTLHIMEAGYLPEIIDPATQEQLGPGERGELVLTNLGRVGSPLIRYRTGDIVHRASDLVCRCGSSEMALEGGILARTDDMLIVRGVNVYPGAVEEILRSCGVTEFRVEVYVERALAEMKIEIEPDPSDPNPDHLVDRTAAALLNTLGFRVTVSCVSCGSLPRFEGKARRWLRA